MLKKFIIVLFILNIFCLPASAQVLDLSSAKDDSDIKQAFAEVYKPSRLIIGDKTEFIVKGEPGTFITIAFSSENEGAEPYYGQELRLGDIVDITEGVIGESGIAKLTIELPDRKDLLGATIYFEALVWQREDLSDIAKARIIGSNGLKSKYNAIIISDKPEKNSMPIFGAGMGGMGNISRTMDALSDQESADKDYLYSDDIYYRSKPLMLRNLRSPELQQENNE